jgi:hypothetical protein
LRGRRERGGDEEGEEGGKEVVRKWMERNEGGEIVRKIEMKEGERQLRGGGREVVMRRVGREISREEEEGEREVVRRRWMRRKEGER